MRPSVLLLAASAVSAARIPATAVNLPASAFPGLHTLSFEDAVNGVDLEHNSTHGTFAPEAAPEEAAPTVLTAAAAACAINTNIRYEWRDFSTPDRQNFINSIQCLIKKPPSGNFAPATNRFEDFARLHQQYTPNIHGNAKFLIWHRYFLWTFEQTLRSECGLTAPFPWWDETKDAGHFSQTDLFGTDYFGYLTGPDSNGNPVCVTTGAFAGLTAHIGPGTGNQAHCLSRSGSASLTSQCNTGFVNTCNSRTSYADMESCAEGGPHAYGHNGIGGAMADVSASPSDPIFYMHHSFVDHGFRTWQNIDQAARTTSINGVDHSGVPLTLDTVVYMGGIMPDVKIRDILNTLSGTVIGGKLYCYRYNY